ncbi:putative ABC transport system permease protein [Fontibacillus phaseoli]|uniref:Putative ABC transport system permease protein n=1 Tax=Fontibacillus phaseoli TaxID=1416533 RepID=A0A369BP09_9BACL|nr:putative ABC transport system permease protein [Fontibacillus phaseoli]
MLRNKRTYAAYFLSSAFSVMVFFVCALFLFHPDLKAQVAWNSALLVLAQAEVIMFLFCFLFVLYSVGSFLRSRKREFGILLMHGMTVRQLRKMVFMENMLVAAGSLGTGILAGLLTAKLFLLAGSNLLGINPLSFHVSLYSLLLTILSFLMLFLVISLCTTMLLGSTRLIDLFQSGIKRDVKPKFSKVLALLAGVLLLVSYALAATATASTVKVRMLPVTAMTIVGTYLFFTQASVALLGLMKKNLARYWKKSNLVLVSNLAYRMKDNARMFFLVTIITTITFCAVGVFASINRLSGDFALDHPAQIGYVSKEDGSLEKKHLEEISGELTARGASYRTEKIDLVYVRVLSSSLASGPEWLPVISFSDYSRALSAAGYSVSEQSPAEDEALVLMSSHREKLLLQERKPASYRLGEGGLLLHEIGITGRVSIADHLTPELGNQREGVFSGLVVNDAVKERLRMDDDSSKVERYTAYYTDSMESTEGIASRLTENGRMDYERGKPYAMTVSGTLFEVQRTTFGALLFFALLVGTVFFIAAGSFLYFRLYSDLDYDRRQYLALTKIGMTRKEMEKMVSRQLGLLFFLPVGVAMVHSLFAFIALQRYVYISIAWEAAAILASFCLVQVIYFWFIRARYLRNLQKVHP